jgi:hypothetical protein
MRKNEIKRLRENGGKPSARNRVEPLGCRVTLMGVTCCADAQAIAAFFGSRVPKTGRVADCLSSKCAKRPSQRIENPVTYSLIRRNTICGNSVDSPAKGSYRHKTNHLYQRGCSVLGLLMGMQAEKRKLSPLLPFRPALLLCLANPLTRRSRQPTLPTVPNWSPRIASASLQCSYCGIKSVPFGFQRVDDRCCIHRSPWWAIGMKIVNEAEYPKLGRSSIFSKLSAFQLDTALWHLSFTRHDLSDTKPLRAEILTPGNP